MGYDSYQSTNQTALVTFRNDDGSKRISIQAVHRLEDEQVEAKRYINLYSTLPEFIESISDPEQYEQVNYVKIEEKTAPVFFFEKESPGWFGESTDTVIAVVESDNTVFFITRHDAFELDDEFKSILGTLQLDEDYTPDFVDISGWETYRSEEFGFALEHPILLPVFVSGRYNSQTLIAVKNADIFNLSVNKDVTYEQTIDGLRGTFGELVNEGKTVSFAGVPAYEIKREGAGFTKILVFDHPEKNIVFVFTIDESSFGQGLLGQILSTFRFVE